MSNNGKIKWHSNERSKLIITYCIAGKLSREKTFADWQEGPFRRMLKSIMGGYGTPNFVEKNFVGGSKTVKFVKVFSLETFPLYSMLI